MRLSMAEADACIVRCLFCKHAYVYLLTCRDRQRQTDRPTYVLCVGFGRVWILTFSFILVQHFWTTCFSPLCIPQSLCLSLSLSQSGSRKSRIEIFHCRNPRLLRASVQNYRALTGARGYSRGPRLLFELSGSLPFSHRPPKCRPEKARARVKRITERWQLCLWSTLRTDVTCDM